MIRQYLEIKEKHQDAILFYRIGDFYEMFFDDAVTASKALDIVLTSRNKNDENPIPLCGVPHHAAQGYIARLVSQGHTVAVCDQVEDPKTAKGVVRREVTRVITPGLLTEAEGLGTKEKSYLAAVLPHPERWGLALLELATGDFRLAELSKNEVMEEIGTFEVRELLLPDRARRDPTLGSSSGGIGVARFSQSSTPPAVRYLPDWVFEERRAQELLLRQFRVATLAGFDCEGIPQGIAAAGAALHYLLENQKKDRLPHLNSLRRLVRSEAMTLPAEVQKTLDLPALWDWLDRTRTSMGARRLRDWLAHPSGRRDVIEERQGAVEELASRRSWRAAIGERLRRIADVERIVGRLSMETALPRDLVALAASLGVMTALEPALQESTAPLLNRILSGWNPHKPLRELISRTLRDEPSPGLKEGGLIREGHSPELDELRKISHDSRGMLASIEERERRRTGIGSLKVRFNRVFGYYIEVTTPNLSKVPADFIRKQTTAQGERFFTPELKEFEDKILGAEEKAEALEEELFVALRETVGREVGSLKEQAGRVAEWDALVALSEVASEEGMVKPVIVDEPVLEIRGGRHPVVERTLPAGRFVPNDLKLNTDDHRLLVITGPNMAGKSTLIRQAGLLAVLAQIGSFVPAKSARIGMVDRIFTRVGASDRLAEGKSTFMVEMSETAAILHNATIRSLILLDEIGRGTSTFDGISLAWAVAEHLHDAIGARTLFATHYHELTELEKTRPGIKNFNVAVREEGDEILFLYRLVRGGMNASYGLHVARLAGLPSPVLERAREVLRNLEQGEFEEGMPRIARRGKGKDGRQQSLF